MKQNEQKKEVKNMTWSIANELRGTVQIEKKQYKNYVLGLVFYRYLSQKIEFFLKNKIEKDTSYKTISEAFEKNAEIKKVLKRQANDRIGYWIEPEHFWSEILNKIKMNHFTYETLQKAFNSFNEGISQVSAEMFEKIFEDIKLYSDDLGKTEESKNHSLIEIIKNIDKLTNHHDDLDMDVLGYVYEIFLHHFATLERNKAGEFYTPSQVSKILAQIVTYDKKQLKNVYDPTCGSGSLLLQVVK